MESRQARFLRVYIDRFPHRSRRTERLKFRPILIRRFARRLERVSQQLSVILDVEELITGPGYVLEVSSPGMDRALRKRKSLYGLRGGWRKSGPTSQWKS